MNQYGEIVLKAPEGMHYVANQLEGEKLILKLIPNSIMTSEEKFKYFVKIDRQCRESVTRWLKDQKGETVREEKFLQRVKQAIQNVDYDYWIVTIEPTFVEGKIVYDEFEEVPVGLSCKDWDIKAKQFAPERGSRLAKLHELMIWYALRIVENKWTLYYVANDSSSAGNYYNAPKRTTIGREKTGLRKCGGYRDGQGNTDKIVTGEDGYAFAFVGGNCTNKGCERPVAEVHYWNSPGSPAPYSSGVVVLTK